MEINSNYKNFLKKLDLKLEKYFKEHSEFIHCKKGCSLCCEKGDYPLSEIELKYLMEGYLSLNNKTKILVQKNFKNIQKGEKCPFLINKECSIYNYRPLICRTHGLAYLIENNTAKVPHCANQSLNYSKCYKNNILELTPIQENLDTHKLLNNFDYGEIKNLYDWLNKET